MYRVHELTNGIPRDILLLCQAAYDKAQDDRRSEVSVADVDGAADAMDIKDREIAAA